MTSPSEAGITVSDRPAWMDGVAQDNTLSSLIFAAAEAEEADRRRTNPVRLSNAGKCQRQTAYAYHNWRAEQAGQAKPFPAESLEPRVLVNFTLGDLTELTVVDWLLKRAGGRFLPLPAKRANAVQLMVDDTSVHGHLDGLWQEPGGRLSVVDIKSISTRGFERIERDGPLADNVAQVNSYCAALELPTWRLIYLRKETGHLKEFTGPFSSDLLQQTVSRFRAVLHSEPDRLPPPEYTATPETQWVRGVKQLGLLLEGMHDQEGKTILERKQSGYWRATGRRVLSFPCSYCAFKASCYGNVQTEMDGDRPVFVVLG